LEVALIFGPVSAQVYELLEEIFNKEANFCPHSLIRVEERTKVPFIAHNNHGDNIKKN